MDINVPRPVNRTIELTSSSTLHSRCSQQLPISDGPEDINECDELCGEREQEGEGIIRSIGGAHLDPSPDFNFNFDTNTPHNGVRILEVQQQVLDCEGRRRGRWGSFLQMSLRSGTGCLKNIQEMTEGCQKHTVYHPSCNNFRSMNNYHNANVRGDKNRNKNLNHHVPQHLLEHIPQPQDIFFTMSNRQLDLMYFMWAITQMRMCQLIYCLDLPFPPNPLPPVWQDKDSEERLHNQKYDTDQRKMTTFWMLGSDTQHMHCKVSGVNYHIPDNAITTWRSATPSTYGIDGVDILY
ncbi:hypothetical protein BD769DRAFT_1384699 [Suillus cothurnatus]|nr:hypothetical protein BD769DRAFT_1384699 [Suillus cothurnatus]